MTWAPANCSGSCTSQVLNFFTFLVQYLGFSYDSKFTSTKTDGKESGLRDEFDFIVVGAGSAGCVVANRLSEIEQWKVLLLESGDEEPAVTGVPGLWPVLRSSSLDYGYYTEPEHAICAAAANKSCHVFRGKVMGGTSALNDMIYARGNKQDYDDWENLGNAGWGFEDVLPYFKKSEDAKDPLLLAKNPDSHGTGGYLTTEQFPYKNKNGRAIIDAWKELGLEEVDYNSGSQVGVSNLQFNSVHGSRLSTNGAFIRPIRGRRSNLVVRPNSRVTRVMINRYSKRVTGVEYFCSKTSTLKMVYAKKEVIISAGAFDSPKLLMLSGVGPAEHLREAGIWVVKNSPVGRNLHEHTVIVPFTFDLKKESRTTSSFDDMRNDLVYWMSSHEGVLSSTGLQSTVAFLQTSFESRPGVPDIQVGFAGSSTSSDSASIATSYYDKAVIFLVLLKPHSRGQLRLNVSDPLWSQPLIRLNSMTDPRDSEILVEGVKLASKVTRTKSLKQKGFIRTKPAMCQEYEVDSREYFECFVKRYTFTSYHPVGTCKMGPKRDKDAVVDPRLRVYGVTGLRVIDASIMPETTRGSINAPIIMIGEKGSDMIKEDWL
ncbi:glucose dehydrogenase [FAD, quinone] [Nasonia vitripennis]|uniref:Glucose-methanol-choline oxidoreductase N-terminal domain-containing protein n=1 Tax=Nasonia vitripennis TaxID=7425 RepID=A0A7M7IUI1_NASVI|nr:glucose dehydrogenase [FAD, quinone] [Nasonia vitripennis]